MLTNELHIENVHEISMIVLNAVEIAIERYGHAHRDFIQNVYEWFSLKLGYKNRKFLYRVFQGRLDAKLGYKDIKKILAITQDKDLFNAIQEDLGYAINLIPAAPNQLELLKR
jgi:hypothetical protein